MFFRAPISIVSIILGGFVLVALLGCGNAPQNVDNNNPSTNIVGDAPVQVVTHTYWGEGTTQ